MKLSSKWRVLLVAALTFAMVGMVSANEEVHYGLDGGCPATDKSGNNRDATCNGNIQTGQSGRFDQSWLFDNSGDYAAYTGGLSNIQDNRTFVCWVEPGSGALTNSEFDPCVTTNDIGYGPNNLHITVNNNFAYQIGDGSSTAPKATISTSGFSDTEWIMMAGRVDESDKVQLDVFSPSKNKSATTNIGFDSQGGTDIYVGRQGTLSRYMNGKIDEVRVYSRYLSDSELKKLYSQNILNSPPSIDSVSTSPSSWTLGSSINVSASVSDDDGTVSSVKADVFENGTQIVNDASLSDSDGDGTWEIDNLFTADKETKYRIELTATDNDGATSTYSTSQTIEDTKPEFRIVKPENKLYVNSTVDWKVNTNSTDEVPGETISLDIQSDGATKDTATLTEGETVTGSFSEADGNHTLTAVLTEQDGTTRTKETFYELDSTPPKINITKPDGPTNSTKNLPLKYSIQEPHLDTSSCKYQKDGGTNFSISNCSNTTIDFGSIGNHSVTVWASDIVGNTGKDTKTVEVDNRNEIKAEVKLTGSQIQNFSVTISSSSKTIGGSTSDGRFEFYTSKMPKGDVKITVSSDGYNTITKTYSDVGDSFNLDTTYTLQRAGVTFDSFDEQTEKKITANFTLENSSVVKTINPKNIFKKTRGPITTGANDGTECIQFDAVPVDEAHANVNSYQNTNNGFDDHFKFYWEDGTTTDYSDSNFGESDGDYTGPIKKLDKICGDITQDSDFAYETKMTWEANAQIHKDSLTFNQYTYLGLPIGSVTATVSSDGYQSRNYFITVDENTKVNLDAYLLKKGKGIYMTIEVRGPNNDKLQGTLVSIQKDLANTRKTISQGKTKTDGTVSFYLSPDISYFFTASYPGYESFTGSFSPVNYQYNPLIVQLGQGNNFTESTTWSSVEYKLLPDQGRLNASATYTFNWTVIDAENGITSFGLRIKNSTGALLDSKSVTGSPSGGSVSLKFNISNSSVESGEELLVEGYFVKDETQFKYQRTYNVLERVTPGLFSVSSIMDDFESSTSDLAQSMVALIFTLAIGSGLKSRFNRVGTGVVCMLVLGVFTLQGWFSPFFWMLTALALIGLLGRRG